MENIIQFPSLSTEQKVQALEELKSRLTYVYESRSSYSYGLCLNTHELDNQLFELFLDMLIEADEDKYRQLRGHLPTPARNFFWDKEKLQPRLDWCDRKIAAYQEQNQ